jgi:dephospho-CoA kinase
MKMAALNKREQNRLMEEIRGGDGRILLGVTGGIASGKSTVARMLEQYGARLIDFDILSRVVVETGKPAWRDITAYFGEQVLLQDKTLDRKKLAEIVFRNSEKRKKLESFIHPRIYDEFRRLVKEYAAKDSNIVIQVVVPLLIEGNLQHLFHKILLVYIPEEMQIERMMRRDRVSREMAVNMLSSQLPIEEKRGYADFIIDNSGPLKETKRQVEEVWEKLKNLPKKKRR